MKRFVPLYLLVFAPFLAACPPPSYVTLFNNTDLPLKVYAASDEAVIAPGRFSRFEAPSWAANDVIRISSGECEYLYDVSSGWGDQPDPYLRRGVQIQVERDLSVNLLPTSYKDNMPASSEMVLRRDGFPLRPVSRKCRQ